MDLDRVTPELRGPLRRANVPGIEHRLGRWLRGVLDATDAGG